MLHFWGLIDIKMNHKIDVCSGPDAVPDPGGRVEQTGNIANTQDFLMTILFLGG